MSAWGLVTTVPGSERSVSVELARLNFLHYIFWLRHTRVVGGRVFNSLMPAFPRYAFVQLEHAWDVVAMVEKITSVVMFAGKPAMLSADLMSRLVSRADADCVMSPEESAKFQIGDRVYVGADGSIAFGHTAIYDRHLGNNRAVVLFDWMGRSVPIDISQNDLSLEQESSKRLSRRRHRRRRPQPEHKLSIDSEPAPLLVA